MACGHRALSEGDCGPCGGLPGMTAVIPSAYGTDQRTALFHTPAKTCHWQLFADTGDVGRWTGDKGRRGTDSV